MNKIREFWFALTEGGKLVIVILLCAIGLLTLRIASNPTPDWQKQGMYMPCVICGKPVQWVGLNVKGRGDSRKTGEIVIVGACSVGHISMIDNAGTKE